MDNKIYTIEELNIKQHSFIVIASKRASGKSILIRNLLKHLLNEYDYSTIIMFSETAHYNNDYDFIDKNLIFRTN